MWKDVIQSDADILGGIPVFAGTRVPVASLFDHLEEGVTVDEFIEDFPSVSKAQVSSILELAGRGVG